MCLFQGYGCEVAFPTVHGFSARQEQQRTHPNAARTCGPIVLCTWTVLFQSPCSSHYICHCHSSVVLVSCLWMWLCCADELLMDVTVLCWCITCGFGSCVLVSYLWIWLCCADELLVDMTVLCWCITWGFGSGVLVSCLWIWHYCAANLLLYVAQLCW